MRYYLRFCVNDDGFLELEIIPKYLIFDPFSGEMLHELV